MNGDSLNEVELARELVRINSENPPGNEKEIAKYIYDYLSDLKFSPELVKFGENRYNIIASMGKSDGLMLNTHMDTVPVGDLKNWKYDPFSARVMGGKIYGRGVSDSKAGVAAILVAVKNNAKRHFKRKLLVALVGDEEVAQRGSKYLIKNRRGIFSDVRYGVIGDSDYEISIGQKGILHVKFTFKGKAAHGSQPEEGDNAILKAADFVKEAGRLKLHKGSTLGDGTLNIGRIIGGTKVNIVADKCEVEVDRRLTWGETPALALKQFKTILRKLDLKADVKLLSQPRLPVKVDKNSKIVNALKNIDDNLRIGVKSGYTEMELYIRDLGIECVACGPVEESQAHVNNEFAKISTIEKTTKLYTNLVRRWCC